MEYFVVKTQQVKKGSRGLRNRANYVVNNKIEEHSNTQITELRSYKKPCLYLDRLASERKQHRQEQGLRGGGIRNYATEFSLNVPPGYSLTDKQWEELTKNVVKEVARVNNLDYRQLRKGVGAVIHREDKTGKTGELPKHEHCHLVIGNLYKAPEPNATPQSIKGITQGKTATCIKQQFTKQLEKHLNLNPRTWKPEPDNIGRNEPLWKARERKVAKAQEANKQKQKEIKKLYNEFVNQYKKWELALEEQNPKQEKRQRKRMNRTLEKVDKFKENNDLQIKENKELSQEIDQYQQRRIEKEQEYKEKIQNTNSVNQPENNKNNKPNQEDTPRTRRKFKM